MEKVIYLLVKIYQWVFRPILGNRCRFYPSCSDYLLEAVEKHGGIRGVFIGIKRVCRCSPWTQGGFDPVPDKQKKE